MNPILAALKDMQEQINSRFDRIDRELAEVRKEIKITQQAVLDISEQLPSEVRDLQQCLDLHRQKFTFIEEEIDMLKEKQ